MNTTFLTTAFTEAEQARIMTVLNSNTPSDYNPDSHVYSIDANGNHIPIALTAHGNDTYDRVFALSSDEVKKYFVFDGMRQDDHGTYEYSSSLQFAATPYAKAHGVDVWTAKDTAACIQMGGGFKYFATECEGYAEKVVLRTLDNYGENKCARNIGANGTPSGTRTVTYDFGDCPVIRLSLQ